MGTAVSSTAIRTFGDGGVRRVFGDDRLLGHSRARSSDTSRIAIGRRKPIYLGGAIGSALGWATMFYAPLSLAGFVAVAALTSAACGAVILGFAYAKESVPVRFLGTISGAINVGNMIGPTILQPAIGSVLDSPLVGCDWPAAFARSRLTPFRPRSR